MKTRIASAMVAAVTTCLVPVAFGRLPLPAPGGNETAIPHIPMPRLSNLDPSPISGALVEETLRSRTLPNIFEDAGRRAAMRRVVEDDVKRSHFVGHLVEDDFFNRHPAWRSTRSPNAPENDGWTWFRGKQYGAQLKTHRSGDPAKYLQDMLMKDTKAEYFLVPDDHEPALRSRIEEKLAHAQGTSDESAVAVWQRQLNRLGKTGRSYAEYDAAVLRTASSAIRYGNVVRVGGVAAVFSAAVDGTVVIYRSADGQLTPEQTVTGVTESCGKGLVVGGATAAAIILGANPVGITVLVVGGITYVVVDYVVPDVRPSYESTPMTDAEINAVMPGNWRLARP